MLSSSYLMTELCSGKIICTIKKINTKYNNYHLSHQSFKGKTPYSEITNNTFSFYLVSRWINEFSTCSFLSILTSKSVANFP